MLRSVAAIAVVSCLVAVPAIASDLYTFPGVPADSPAYAPTFLSADGIDWLSLYATPGMHADTALMTASWDDGALLASAAPRLTMMFEVPPTAQQEHIGLTPLD